MLLYSTGKYIQYPTINHNRKEYKYIYLYIHTHWLPWWLSGKEPSCQLKSRRRHRFDSRVGKIPWRRVWQPTPVFLPGKSHRQRSLAGYCPWAHSQTRLSGSAHTYTRNYIHTHRYRELNHFDAHQELIK